MLWSTTSIAINEGILRQANGTAVGTTTRKRTLLRIRDIILSLEAMFDLVFACNDSERIRRFQLFRVTVRDRVPRWSCEYFVLLQLQ